MVCQFGLVHNLDSNDVLLVVLVECLEYLSECARAQHMRMRINLVILFQLFSALLLLRL